MFGGAYTLVHASLHTQPLEWYSHPREHQRLNGRKALHSQSAKRIQMICICVCARKGVCISCVACTMRARDLSGTSVVQ